MICPYCQTDNRDDREACYYCKKDLSMLRLIVNKAKLHYNQGLEFAERGRLDDAIGELKNALDLDGSMDNALVVLGTLYAKKEMFPEARECWTRALALNHNLDRAHEYLRKAEKAEFVFPAIKRLRKVAIGLGGALAVALILVLFLGSLASVRKDRYEAAVKYVDPDLDRVRKTAVALKSSDLTPGAALASLEKVAASEKASPASRDLATALSDTIKHDWQRRLDLASRANRASNAYTALQILDTVAQEDPSPEVRQSIDRLTATTQENILAWVNNSADYYMDGRLPYERFSYESQRFLERMKDDKGRQEVEALRAKVDRVNNERMLNEAQEVIASGPIVKAADTLAQWDVRSPAVAEALRKTMAQRLAAENANAIASVRALMADKDFDRAEARVEEFKLLYNSIRRPVPQDILSELSGQVKTGRMEAAYAAAREAFAAKNWEKFLELSKTTQTLAINEQAIADLASMRREAEANQIRAALTWFRDRDTAFRNAALSAEDATKAVRLYPVALKNTNWEYALSQATILFDAAVAHVKLEQPAEATTLLQRLQKDHPNTGTAGRGAKLLKRLEEEAAKRNAPPQQPQGEQAPAKPAPAAGQKPAPQQAQPKQQAEATPAKLTPKVKSGKAAVKLED